MSMDLSDGLRGSRLIVYYHSLPPGERETNDRSEPFVADAGRSQPTS